MTKKSKANPWQIISAILAALGSLFSSLKKSHDEAHASSDEAHASSDSDPSDC